MDQPKTWMEVVLSTDEPSILGLERAARLMLAKWLDALGMPVYLSNNITKDNGDGSE